MARRLPCSAADELRQLKKRQGARFSPNVRIFIKFRFELELESYSHMFQRDSLQT